MMPGFRKTSLPNEIFQKLLTISRQKPKGTFWQVNENKKRIICFGKLQRLSLAEKMVIAQSDAPKGFTKFEGHRPINIYFEDFKLLFSIPGFFIQEDLLYFEFPSEAYAPESREKPRASVRSLKGNLSMEFSLGGRGQTSTIVSLRILDLSSSGVGLIDPGVKTRPLLAPNSVISIHRICGQGLDRALVGKVAYLKDIPDLRHGGMKEIRRIGIKFYREIDHYRYLLPFLEKVKKPG